jgi:hypothetical protein
MLASFGESVGVELGAGGAHRWGARDLRRGRTESGRAAGVRGLGGGSVFSGWMATETGIVRSWLVVGRHGHLNSHPLSCMSFLASLYRVSV